MDFESAATALTDAANTSEPGQVTEPVAPQSTSEVTPAPSGVEGTTEQTTPDSFTGVDPTTLSPELQQIYRSMQGDYTRTKQQLSEQAKAFEGIDADQARQSIEFVTALESDPQFVVAVHQRLSEALQAAGLSPAEAQAEAASQLGGGQNPSLGTGFGDEEPDSQLAKEVAELRAWKDQQEQNQFEQNLSSHLQRQEMAIRQADPNLTEGDMDRIYQLAFAHNGDLDRAYGDFKSWRDDIVGSYVERKGEVPAGVSSPSGAGAHASIPPEGFGDDLNKATAGAIEYLRSVQASS